MLKKHHITLMLFKMGMRISICSTGFPVLTNLSKSLNIYSWSCSLGDLRVDHGHPVQDMSTLHVALYIPLQQASEGTKGALVRLLPGVDEHVTLEMIAATAGPPAHGTTQLSPATSLLTHHRLTQTNSHWLTHQHSSCFFQLQRNSLYQ